MIEEGARVRLKIQLYGSVPVGAVCKVKRVHDERGKIIDIECDHGGWRTVHTVWAREVEAIEQPAAPDDPAPGSPPHQP